VDGLGWRVLETGPPDGPCVLLLHGFTGSGDYWRRVAEGLHGRRVLAPDLPGHGGTDPPVPQEEWCLPRLAGALFRLMDRVGVPTGASSADWIGYSMGGRAALHAALGSEAARIGRLVLVGTSPGITEPAARTHRADADRELAARITGEKIESFVDEWERLPLFAGEQDLPAESRAEIRARRLSHDPHGLAAALLAFSVGYQEDLTDRLGGITMPVLLVAGGLDEKYITLCAAMRERIPGAEAVGVRGSGHSVPVEDPNGFLAAVGPFLGLPREQGPRDEG
jgi:2-succinyl-6-hydroxy-2,4-cyclohexadiene-1-carboxylate synthase